MIGGLAQRTQQTAADIAEALSVAAPPAQPMQPPPNPQAAPSPPAPNGFAVTPPGEGKALLGSMSDFRSPPLAAALQGARGAQGPTGL